MWYNYPNQHAKKFLSLYFLSVIVAVWGHTSFEKAQSCKDFEKQYAFISCWF